jgi:hypothetical protein
VSMCIQFNGDAGATNYSVQRLTGSQTTVSAGWDISYPNLIIDSFPGDSAAAGENAAFTIHIPHYNSDFHKTIVSTGGIFVSPTGTGASLWTGRWINTSKVESIKFFPETSTYPNAKIQAGSLISIYGLK